jgi:4'-phosphopantetheinyl transferase
MMLELLWEPLLEPPALGADDVHVWAAALGGPATEDTDGWATLSADEQARALRFRFERDRRHYVAARGLLRELLARYTGRQPTEMRFDYSAYGKPALRDGGPAFNLSHSHGLALIAVSLAPAVGVDVEFCQADFASLPVARQFFSVAEVAAWCRLPEAAQVEAFFNCWTRKEAFVKALGEGLSYPLKDFEVSLAPGEPAALLRVRSDPAAAQRWQLTELTPARGYAAALAVAGERIRVSAWRWPRPDAQP